MHNAYILLSKNYNKILAFPKFLLHHLINNHIHINVKKDKRNLEKNYL